MKANEFIQQCIKEETDRLIEIYTKALAGQCSHYPITFPLVWSLGAWERNSLALKNTIKHFRELEWDVSLSNEVDSSGYSRISFSPARELIWQDPTKE